MVWQEELSIQMQDKKSMWCAEVLAGHEEIGVVID